MADQGQRNPTGSGGVDQRFNTEGRFDRVVLRRKGVDIRPQAEERSLTIFGAVLRDKREERANTVRCLMLSPKTLSRAPLGDSGWKLDQLRWNTTTV